MTTLDPGLRATITDPALTDEALTSLLAGMPHPTCYLLARSDLPLRVLHALSGVPHLDHHTVEALGANAAIDPHLVDWLSARRDGRIGLAQNPGLTRMVRVALVEDPDDEVTYCLGRNPSLEADLQHRLFARGARRSLARNPSLDPSLQALLLRDDEDETTMCELAKNPTVTRESQDTLFAHPFTHYFLAGNQALAPHHAEALSVHPDEEVRSTLAANPSLPERLLEALASDSSWLVRVGVASNPRLCGSVLGVLLGDGDTAAVLTRLERNPAIGDVELGPDLPLAFFAVNERTRKYRDDFLSGCDAATRASLELGFQGNLLTFRRVLQSLAPDSSA